MFNVTRILVNGALGRMGSEVVRTVLKQNDMELVAAVDIMAKPTRERSLKCQ